jgi:hypothetical protein
MARTTYIALLLAVSAVAVAGCGGNDDSASKTSAQSGVSGQQGTTSPQTGATGTTGATGKTGGAVKTGSPANKTGTPKRSGSQSGGTRAEPETAAPAAPSPPKKKAKPPYRLTEEQTKQAAPAFYKEAYAVCKAYTVDLLARDLKVKSHDPEVVAKVYASSWPTGLHKAVAAGCKKGLVESK